MVCTYNGGFQNRRATIYLPAVTPGIAAMLMWYYIYYPDQTGLLNMVLVKFGMEPFSWLNNPTFVIPGIMIYPTWKGFAGAILLYYASVQSVSVELYIPEEDYRRRKHRRCKGLIRKFNI